MAADSPKNDEPYLLHDHGDVEPATPGFVRCEDQLSVKVRCPMADRTAPGPVITGIIPEIATPDIGAVIYKLKPTPGDRDDPFKW